MTHTHRQPYSRIRMRLKRIINVIRWGKKVWFTEFARPTTRAPAMELEYMQVMIFFDCCVDVDDYLHDLHRLFYPN